MFNVKHFLPYQGDDIEDGDSGSDSRTNPIDPGENDEVCVSNVEEQVLAFLEHYDNRCSKK